MDSRAAREGEKEGVHIALPIGKLAVDHLSTATVVPTRSSNIMVTELPTSQGPLSNLSSFEVAAAPQDHELQLFFRWRIAMKKANFLAALMMLASCILAVAQTAQQSAPKVKVGTQLTAKAATPAPGAKAKNTTQKASVGKGAASVKASQPSSFWTEEMDVDDDGTVETNDYLYDAQRGVLYTYREDDFACPNGNPESGSILMALYAKGNPANKPVGSGWYLVNLNAGQCAAKKAGTFGCKFDASGNATECGAATVNNATGEIDVVVAK